MINVIFFYLQDDDDDDNDNIDAGLTPSVSNNPEFMVDSEEEQGEEGEYGNGDGDGDGDVTESYEIEDEQDQTRMDPEPVSIFSYFFSVFFQVSAAVKSLQEIYARDDVELSNLFKIVIDAMNVYNMKLKTMQKIRDMIRDNIWEGEYNRWSGQYVTKKPMHIQVGTVSIVILKKIFFFFFKIKHCIEHY